MARAPRIAVILLGIVLLVLFSVASMTGLYIVSPIGAVPEGESIWYYRRGTGLPMISSADGLNLQYNNGATPENRSAMNAKIATIIGKHVIVKLPYFSSLYLWSTGNRDFSKLGVSPKGAPSPATPSSTAPGGAQASPEAAKP